MSEERDKRFFYNIVAEAKMMAYVEMTKKYMPSDQVRQFCTEMLERAFKKAGIP